MNLQSAPPTPLLLRVTEVAATLGISRSAVYELIASGQLEAVHIGRSRRVPVDALQQLVARLRRAEVDLDA